MSAPPAQAAASARAVAANPSKPPATIARSAAPARIMAPVATPTAPKPVPVVSSTPAHPTAVAAPNAPVAAPPSAPRFRRLGPPVLGVTLSGPGPTGRGVVVGEVLAGTVAEDAGLQSGDVVIEVSGRSIHGPTDLAEAIRRVSPGAVLPVTVVRDGRPRTLQVQF